MTFPYKWTDKTNRPHTVPHAFMSNGSIGGNAHENWSLLRFLPFLVGHLVPPDESAWQVLMELKDIVELVVAPVQTAESIAYLESKICDHRRRLQEVFPELKLLPKHHYVEHYPLLIKSFGPLVGVWTLRFKAKHRFFKQVARYTHCFKNILLTLAVKHQFMMAYHLECANIEKSSMSVSDVSTVPVGILNQDVVNSLKQTYPDVTCIHLAKNVSVDGVNYRNGMIVVRGLSGSLPVFAEIVQMVVVERRLSFIVKEMSAWYWEHFRAFELCPTLQVSLIHHNALADYYPLADYHLGGRRMVTLKRFINTRG